MTEKLDAFSRDMRKILKKAYEQGYTDGSLQAANMFKKWLTDKTNNELILRYLGFEQEENGKR